jgi:hypothetical protein
VIVLSYFDRNTMTQKIMNIPKIPAGEHFKSHYGFIGDERKRGSHFVWGAGLGGEMTLPKSHL